MRASRIHRNNSVIQKLVHAARMTAGDPINWKWVILGFLGSSAVLLIVSWGLALVPGLPWRGKEIVGVPVKDYILQSELFVICAFGLIGRAACMWRARTRVALLIMRAAALFIGNILYVETARTTLIVMAVLPCLFGGRQLGWKGVLGACAIGAVLSGARWMTSPHLHERVSRAIENIQAYDANNVNTPIGQRLEYWKKSLKFVEQAPVLGHGTGSILTLFQRAATAHTHPSTITGNPHNQVLVFALELGIVGASLCSPCGRIISTSAGPCFTIGAREHANAPPPGARSPAPALV